LGLQIQIRGDDDETDKDVVTTEDLPSPLCYCPSPPHSFFLSPPRSSSACFFLDNFANIEAHFYREGGSTGLQLCVCRKNEDTTCHHTHIVCAFRDSYIPHEALAAKILGVLCLEYLCISVDLNGTKCSRVPGRSSSHCAERFSSATCERSSPATSSCDRVRT
jgi:hypothetical protein